MARYIKFPIEINPSTLLQRAFDYIQALVPGWTPAEGNLDVWLLEAVATETAELTGVASRVPDTLFRYYGQSLMGITPIDATAATADTTWTMRDSAGHTVPAGTQVGIRNADGVLIQFYTANEVTVPPGNTVTAAGAITIIATDPGADGSGLGSVGGNVELTDILDFVLSITQTGITTGGVDAESDGDYLNRLVLNLQLLTRTPILPDDFAKLALNIAPAYRAVALDGYNPGDDTFGNDRMVYVVAVDSAGNALSAPQKTAIDNYLQSLREVNFIVNVGSPTYTTIAITTDIHVLPGFDAATVRGAVASALANFINPSSWGQPVGGSDRSGDAQEWLNDTVVRLYDVSHVIKGVDGVDYINTLTMGIPPAGLTAANVNLPGRVPLPLAGTMTVTSS